MSEGPKVLTLDIETSPTSAYVWGLFNQNIGLNQIIQPTRVICFAAKWVGDPRVQYFSEFHHGHEVMVNAAHSLLNEADALVTYNGDNFDIPHLNREFQELGIGRPAPFHSIDLYKVIKKHHRFISNKLAHVTGALQLTGKMETGGFDLWRDCMAGNRTAWNKMRRYNKADVVTTEELYVELMPWIDNHPTYQLYVANPEEPACPRCGSDALQKRGYRTTKVSRFQQYQCQTCGSWSRAGRRVQGVDVR